MIIESHGWSSVWDVPLPNTLVIPTNASGIQGAGLAKQWRDRYPVDSDFYTWMCRQRSVDPGEIVIMPRHARTFIALPTKDDPRKPSKLTWVHNGLINLAYYLESHPDDLVLLPAVGCGLGGLDWEVVRALYDTAFEHCDNRILIWGPR